jgi:hypothetical protein
MRVKTPTETAYIDGISLIPCAAGWRACPVHRQLTMFASPQSRLQPPQSPLASTRIREHIMAETKTKPTGASVTDFLAAVEDPQKRADSQVLLEMMSRITGHKPKMWGPSIVGFGSYHYKYASGHEGDACLAGFSPRKSELTVYLSVDDDLDERNALLARLGKHRMTTACLYIKRLEQVDIGVLEQLVRQSVEATKAKYPTK